MRFGFNNGTSSIVFGNRVKIRESFTLPKDVDIKKVMVSVRGDDEYLDAIIFLDEKDQPILEIRGNTVKGVMKTMQLEKDMHIIGVKANMCEKYIRGIGFFVWKLGMGVPLDKL